MWAIISLLQQDIIMLHPYILSYDYYKLGQVVRPVMYVFDNFLDAINILNK